MLWEDGMGRREDLVFTLEDLDLTEEGRPMSTTLVVNERKDAFTVLKDFCNMLMLMFLKDTLAQEGALQNGEALTLSGQAVCGLAELLETIADGLNDLADDVHRQCTCQKGGK
jgi:hypothetical protein